MKEPLRITYRGIEPTPAIEAKIRERAARLDRYYDDIISCHVTVDTPHRSQVKAKLYDVRIDLVVKGAEIVVRREPAQHPEHTDLYVAIRDAFDAAKRRLQDHARRQRREVKVNEHPPRARVARIFPDEGYGFLETPDGREIYFHRNSVLNGAFDRLTEGTLVRYAEEQGTEGPQASTVALP
ncbi:MAG TPA: HPF/RaiA family ribosome-associated protein [Candidatus Binatia bacterium]